MLAGAVKRARYSKKKLIVLFGVRTGKVVVTLNVERRRTLQGSRGGVSDATENQVALTAGLDSYNTDTVTCVRLGWAASAELPSSQAREARRHELRR